MEETREISALFHLMDDPDGEVFGMVSDRIISFGKNIIPNLEHLWENTPDENTQERIELLIHRLHFRDLTDDFTKWKDQPEPDLLGGALLAAKYQYPELTAAQALQEVEKMRRNIWLELNGYLTCLEQTKVITTILYKYYRIKGVEVAYTEPNDFLLNKLLDARKGNTLNNGILLLIISNLLDIPIRAVNIPRQFILAYYDVEDGDWEEINKNPADRIQFYIDPTNGQVYTQKDVDTYFHRISVPPVTSYFKPLDNKKVIQLLLEELAKCFEKDKHLYKFNELMGLSDLLGE
ncbi:transglutaminase family protein [Chitinophagaceae bacterium 26-R-25]|nr:transglutaminase family protein [Chitinophagaceae bacterium 26-R-25]